MSRVENIGGTTLNSYRVLNLLAIKHSKDVFVSECKDGPSQFGPHLRMDAWAMARSWANPIVTAYEIKVSRGDFLKDEKWHGYLPYCNAFYFVSPIKMIAPEELPPDVGLMWCSDTGSRLHTKRHAVYRKVEIPESLYRYILMCRAIIKVEDTREKEDFTDWKEWLKEKGERTQVGIEIGYKINRIVDEKCKEIKRENSRLEHENETYAEVKKVMDELGVPNSRWEAAREARTRMLSDDRAQEAVKQIKETMAHLENLLDRFTPPSKPRQEKLL